MGFVRQVSCMPVVSVEHCTIFESFELVESYLLEAVKFITDFPRSHPCFNVIAQILTLMVRGWEMQGAASAPRSKWIL